MRLAVWIVQTAFRSFVTWMEVMGARGTACLSRSKMASGTVRLDGWGNPALKMPIACRDIAISQASMVARTCACQKWRMTLGIAEQGTWETDAVTTTSACLGSVTPMKNTIARICVFQMYFLLVMAIATVIQRGWVKLATITRTARLEFAISVGLWTRVTANTDV